MKPNKLVAAGIIVGIQIAFLCGMIGYHQQRVHSGVRIRLENMPVDPFSLFRGRYMTLNYKIARLEKQLFNDADWRAVKKGSPLYVALAQDGEYWKASKVSLQKPPAGLFVKGKAEYEPVGKAESIQANYGIETFFLSETSADLLESRPRPQADTWQVQQAEREKRIAELSPDHLRLYKNMQAEAVIRVLEQEGASWVAKGTVTHEALNALVSDYQLKQKQIQEAIRLPESLPAVQATVDPLVIEASVTPDGTAYAVKLIWQGKEYR